MASPEQARADDSSGEVATPIYVVFDCSGSTERDGFLASCNAALPAVVAAVESTRTLLVLPLLSVLTYADHAAVALPLGDPGLVEQLPLLAAHGLSSLGRGLTLAAAVIREDVAQLEADGLSVAAPTVVAVIEDLGTDPASALLQARDDLVATGACLHVAHALSVDALSLAALGARRLVPLPHPVTSSTLAAAVTGAVACGRTCAGGPFSS